MKETSLFKTYPGRLLFHSIPFARNPQNLHPSKITCSMVCERFSAQLHVTAHSKVVTKAAFRVWKGEEGEREKEGQGGRQGVAGVVHSWGRHMVKIYKQLTQIVYSR